MEEEKNYCVKNMKKRHRADIKGLQKEANREIADETWYNSKVNLARSYLNVYLIKCNNWQEAIDATIEDAGVKTKVDSVVAVTAVYSASADWFETHSQAEAMAYFKKCLAYEQTKGVVISAVIHADETTPHMHTCSVPIVQAPDIKNEYVYKTVKDANGEDALDANGNKIYEIDAEGNKIHELDKKQRKKRKKNFVRDDAGNIKTHKALSAQALFGGRAQMSSLQTEFFDVCGKPFGMERGHIRINSGEIVKRRAELEFREAMVRKDAEQIVEDKAVIKKKKREIAKAQEIADDGIEIVAQYNNGLNVVLAEQEKLRQRADEEWEEYCGEMADVYIAKREVEKEKEHLMAEIAAVNALRDAYTANMERLQRLLQECAQFKLDVEEEQDTQRYSPQSWMQKHKIKGETLWNIYLQDKAAWVSMPHLGAGISKADLQRKQKELMAKAEEYTRQSDIDLQKGAC